MVKHWLCETEPTRFEEISGGQFFCMAKEDSNSIFIKLECPFEEGATDFICNAISLQGESCEFDDNDLIYKINVPFEDIVTYT